ncbi:MAG TPA: alpha/beta hydrolase [Acidimicrobiia bacterium]|nr:alpha/beta hydrolase [Acidimicrobiia bacterium]
MPTIAANGIELYFERPGAGPRLLFLNGSGSTIETSRLLIQPFTERFEVLAFDQRGLGLSAIPPGPYEMADYAADAIGLLDAVGWPSCRVFGVSFGGMVAQELAVTAPDRIERLVLSCTSPGGAAGASYPLHELAAMPADEAAALGMRLLDTRFTPEYLAANAGDRGLAEMMVARRSAEKSDEQRRGEAEQMMARSRHDVVARLGAISAPTLVAAGRYDGIAPLPNSEAIASRVPNAELRVYEGGHAFFAQDAKALPEIFDFLAQ